MSSLTPPGRAETTAPEGNAARPFLGAGGLTWAPAVPQPAGDTRVDDASQRAPPTVQEGLARRLPELPHMALSSHRPDDLTDVELRDDATSTRGHQPESGRAPSAAVAGTRSSALGNVPFEDRRAVTADDTYDNRGKTTAEFAPRIWWLASKARFAPLSCSRADNDRIDRSPPIRPGPRATRRREDRDQ